jgi:hypothetical protein
MIEVDGRAPGNLARFFTILIGFCLLDLVSWPILFSYYLWVFADRSNFLNLDYMLAEHLRLGVDAYYAYGLLPVFIQHVLFSAFGRGYWPMIGCTVVVLIWMAAFWSRFVGYLSDRWTYLAAVVAISPYLLWINPNLAYSLVQLSMLFALLFLLEGRLEVALAVSVIGCFSVPSLPLLLAGVYRNRLVDERQPLTAGSDAPPCSRNVDLCSVRDWPERILWLQVGVGNRAADHGGQVLLWVGES